MAGHTPWREVRAKLAPEVQEGIDALTTSYRLRGLREARGLTQAEMADRLEIRQVSVSRMEARSDVRVSTLRAVIEAMGGELQIRAASPDAGLFKMSGNLPFISQALKNGIQSMYSRSSARS